MRDVKPDPQIIDSLKQRIERLSMEQKNALNEALAPQLASGNAKLAASYVTTNNHHLSPDELRAFASASLPKNSVPQVFKQVKSLPKTETGKIQRKNLSHYKWDEVKANNDPDNIDDDDFLAMFDDAEYVAPRNATETTLTQIWTEVLGVDQVSVEDDFIEVGGDSLLSIRILARINKAGLSIATEDFFQYPTIAGQAAAIIKASESNIQNTFDLGETSGSFGLTPIQHWFFDNIQNELHHWNQATRINVSEHRTFVNLQRAVTTLHKVHDALRISIQGNEQHYESLSNRIAVDYVDVSSIDDALVKSVIQKRCNLAHQSFKLNQGYLSQFILFKTKEGTDNLLVIIAHHLIVDAESWRILLEDLDTSWQQYELGKRPELPDKTSSFRLWSEKLQEFASSPKALGQVPYWQAQKSNSRLPLDFTNTPANIDEISTSFNTRVLRTALSTDMGVQDIEKLIKSIHVNMRELLIFCLLESLYSWSGENEILLDIESHGREALFNKVDISRTVGWFTTVFPCLFTRELSSEDEPSDHILDSLNAVKNTLNKIPNNGIAHGVLKYLGDNALSEIPQAQSQVCFNFLGRVDTTDSDVYDLGQQRSANSLKAYLLEVNAQIVEEQLVFEWSYNASLHKAETIEALAEIIEKRLRALIDVCKSLDMSLTHEAAQSPVDGATIEAEFIDDEDDMFDLDNFDAASLDALSNALSSTQTNTQSMPEPQNPTDLTDKKSGG